jgi:hypothetical protein
MWQIHVINLTENLRENTRTIQVSFMEHEDT